MKYHTNNELFFKEYKNGERLFYVAIWLILQKLIYGLGGLVLKKNFFNSKKSHHNLNRQMFKNISELREKYLLSLMILFLGVLSLTAFYGKITNYASRKKRPTQFLVNM